METRKADDVKTWVNQHSRVENNDEKQRSGAEEKEPYRPRTPPFPPPVTTSSADTVVKSDQKSLSSGIHVNGNNIQLGVGDHHVNLTPVSYTHLTLPTILLV